MYGMLMKRNLSSDTFHKSPCTCYRVSLHNFSVEPLYYWAEELWLSDWGFHADHHKIKSSSPQYLFHIPYQLIYKFMYIYFSGRSLYLNSLFHLQHTPWHIDTHRTPRCYCTGRWHHIRFFQELCIHQCLRTTKSSSNRPYQSSRSLYSSKDWIIWRNVFFLGDSKYKNILRSILPKTKIYLSNFSHHHCTLLDIGKHKNLQYWCKVRWNDSRYYQDLHTHQHLQRSNKKRDQTQLKKSIWLQKSDWTTPLCLPLHSLLVYRALGSQLFSISFANSSMSKMENGKSNEVQAKRLFESFYFC